MSQRSRVEERVDDVEAILTVLCASKDLPLDDECHSYIRLLAERIVVLEEG